MYLKYELRIGYTINLLNIKMKEKLVMLPFKVATKTHVLIHKIGNSQTKFTSDVSINPVYIMEHNVNVKTAYTYRHFCEQSSLTTKVSDADTQGRLN